MNGEITKANLIKIICLIADDLQKTTISSALKQSYVDKHGHTHESTFEFYYKSNSLLDNSQKKGQVEKFLKQHLTPLYKQAQSFNNQSAKIKFKLLEQEDSWNRGMPHEMVKVSELPLDEEYSLTERLGQDAEVFISHSNKDKRFADKLSNYLSLLGYTSFVAHKSIYGGSNWSRDIEKNLNHMQIFIPCISAIFQKSIYCHQECGYAVARKLQGNGVEIIPLQLGRQSPKAMLANIQGISISEKMTGTHLSLILKAIQSNRF